MGPVHPLPFGTQIVAVNDLEILPGVTSTGQSHSISMRCNVTTSQFQTVAVALYLKKVFVNPEHAHVDEAGARRDLHSCLNEVRFYEHMAPLLCQHHFCLPTPVAVEAQSYHGEEYSIETMLSSQYFFLLEHVNLEKMTQVSPLSRGQTHQSLLLLAQLHSFAWESREKIALARRHLHPKATYWDLEKRGRAELSAIPEVWEAFRITFRDQSAEAAEVLGAQGMENLGERLMAVADYVHAKLHRASTKEDEPIEYVTLVHGDFKAMNVFLPLMQEKKEEAERAMPIDFQWTGVGDAMLDVAQHLYHSVSLEAMEHGGEEELLEYYHAELCACLPPEAAGRTHRRRLHGFGR